MTIDSTKFQPIKSSLPKQSETTIADHIRIYSEKYYVVIEEMKIRQKEICIILKNSETPSLMILYLICLHHELYIKSKMGIDELRTVLEGKSRCGHDLKELLIRSTSVCGKERSMILEHVRIIEDLAPKIRDERNYTHIRYNFLRKCFSDEYSIDEIKICDCDSNIVTFEMLRRMVCEYFFEGV